MKAISISTPAPAGDAQVQQQARELAFKADIIHGAMPGPDVHRAPRRT